MARLTFVRYYFCRHVVTSQEKVLKKVNGKWAETNGYELNASMEIKSGGEPRNYDVTVWHTKPDFYRVEVVESGKDVSQMIVRNADGVFVVTPTLNKMYKFKVIGQRK